MAAGYNISIDGGGAIDVGDVLEYDATGLTPFQEYSFRVQRRDSQGNVSAWSPTVLATPVPYVLYGGDIVTHNGDPVYYS